MGSLEFFRPDMERFPCLGLAMEAGRQGGVSPIAFNAANDLAVEAYLAGRIGFYGISDLVERTLSRFHGGPEPALAEISRMDEAVREYIRKSLS